MVAPFHSFRPGLRTAVMLALLAIPFAAAAAPPAPPPPVTPPLLQAMEGTWAVTEKMWPGSGQAVVDLPPATAHRRLIQKSFIEEVMEPSNASAADAFNRTSYFEFNSTTHQFEYFSLDSRLPQMMNERSSAMDAVVPAEGWVKLDGSHFVAPTWGQAKNVPFHYRLAVGAVEGNRQTVRLFLQPESGSDRKEFLAFEYVYVRLP